MPARIDQTAVVMLAVEFDQMRGKIAQQCDADRLVVDESLAAAICLELPSHDQRLARFDLDPCLAQQGGRSANQIEHRSHRGAVLPRAHQPTVGPVAQHQPQRIEQDRLARPGLAGEHAEATGEIQIKRRDQHHIAYGKPGEHGYLPA